MSLYECAHGWHDNDGSDICTRCGTDLNPAADPAQDPIECKLHALARAFMATRPDLEESDLDAWLLGHHEKLSPAERAAGHAILELCYEKDAA